MWSRRRGAVILPRPAANRVRVHGHGGRLVVADVGQAEPERLPPAVDQDQEVVVEQQPAAWKPIRAWSVRDATCSGPNTAGGREASLAGAGPTWQSTHRVITRDGRTIWVRDEAVLVYDDAGEPRYWQGLSFNITDRTMAELEATRRLAALDELRNSMLTAISHELRTPLAGILGASMTLECAGGRMSEEATAELLRGSALAPASSTGC
jgi:signal transduction histidine kinase